MQTNISDLRCKAGFSLIELLVATAVLMIVVLIASMIFHQSSLSWESGMRRVQGSMTGRSIVSLMAREMQGAVADPVRFNDGSLSDGAIEFNTLDKGLIKYKATSGHELTRNGLVVADDIESLTFTKVGDGDFKDSMPSSVKIELKVKRRGDVSGVCVTSAGPDKDMGSTNDNVRSW